jgi:hypothetical protein
MSTVTLKINDETKAGKALLAMIEFFKNQKGIELVDTKANSADEEHPYNPEFVKMVKKSAASKKRIEVTDVNKLWDSL